MPDTSYSASKTRTKRPGWSITFRHPLRSDARGKPGLKMRRGLGTTDETDADRLVAEMNTLLSDQTWWSAGKRTQAEQEFSKSIVDAFYNEIQAGREDPEALREEVIPLPRADDGYSRVLFVGTTGAGKTSLLRQLIGSDPDKDRFPSTAPAKTTIADIEVVQSDGDYESVVTFFTEFQTQASVEECIMDACVAVFEGAAITKVADRFLNHRDQKFRLGYILGGWTDTVDTASNDEDFSFDEQSASVDNSQDESVVTVDEKASNTDTIRSFLERIESLTSTNLKRLTDDLGIDPKRPSGADQEAAEELIQENFEAYITEDESFHELVQDVLEAVRQRFDLVEVGTLERRRSGWPKRWRFETPDRAEFLSQIRWFSSNYWPQFGRLLTPLVCGIRVKGPLFPSFNKTAPRLVLIDGQGLGHTPDSSSSVTTHITKRFDHVDVILLVDNAQQPMQAAPLSVLRTVATSGHNGKLAIAFTHFDQIKGPSLRTSADKRGHVMASVLNALANLRDVLGAPVVRAIEHKIESRCFMLGGVEKNLSQLPDRAADYMRSELFRVVEFCEQAILPPLPPNSCPVYDPTGISFAVRKAASNFQDPWLARLGLATHDGVKKEHWTRIKALNRRIAAELDDEYQSLQPVADLVARLTESISGILDKPDAWTREPEDDQERQAAIDRVRRSVSTAMHELASTRIVEQHLAEWRNAYELRRAGSTSERARAISSIYGEAAPVPDSVMPPPSRLFLAEVRRLVIDAIEKNGGRVQIANTD